MRLIYNYFILLSVLIFNLVSAQDSIMMKSFSVNKYNEFVETEIDTNLNYFEIYDFSVINSYNNNNLSNIGLASQSYLLHYRKTGFLFNNSMYDNLISQKSIKYFNTKKHFTNLSFFTNFSKKNNNQVLRVLHTQNVTKKFNVGLIYNMVSSTGEYSYQSSADNSVSVFTSYDSKKYNCNGNFIYNKLKNENNGGISDKYVNDEIINTNIKAIPTWLNNSKSINMNRALNFYQSLKFYSNNIADTTDTIIIKDNYFRISHKLNYQYSRLNYYNDDTISDFYEIFNIDTAKTKDSTFQNIINNTLYFDYNIITNKTNKRIGLSYINSIENFYYYNSNKNYYNSGIGGLYSVNDTTSYNYLFGFNYFFYGRKQNDFSVFGQYSKHIIDDNYSINCSVEYKNINPEYFEEHFFANNALWDTSFAKNKTLIDFEVKLNNLTHFLEIGLHYGVYDNTVYFAGNNIDTTGISISPFQETHTINYYSVYLKKDLNFKHFRINNKFSYQKSDNKEVLSVPEFSFFNSSSYKFVLVKNVLVAEIGIDFFYYTKFKADAYMPSVSMFYRQNDVEIGNYPKIDAFLKLKLKRARLFIKYEHANFGLMGSNYYAGVYQPMAPRIFRFGVSWSFYD